MLLSTYSAVVRVTIGETKLNVNLRGLLLRKTWCSPENDIVLEFSTVQASQRLA